ncbi:MAG: glycosyltransferase family 2 protein [Prevotella sp.]|nr:glycosyltransferase family 2 protein [Prevotella sp.]
MVYTLTIFTPTYNRAATLHLCYESLCRQTCRDFMWLIIDDGSTDNTRELVEDWKNEGRVPISYFHQENQGMHGAHNAAYRLIDTELNTCIDSDDYMPDDAVEKIVTFWQRHGSREVAGIIALDTDFEGQLIGTSLPNRERITLGGYYSQGGRGDKKLIYRTDIIRSYPEYPLFAGEKYVSLGYKYELIDQDYELLVMNEAVCRVNYQPDGSTKNMYRQYIRNPKGFAFIRKQSMVLAPTAKRRFVEAIHYVSSSIMLRNKHFIKESPRPWLVICAIPFGILLHIYINFKVHGS